MRKLGFCLAAGAFGLAVLVAADAQALCDSQAENGGCVFFGLPEPVAAGQQEMAAAAAAAQVGGVVCRLGQGEGAPLVAGHEASCASAGGTVVPGTGVPASGAGLSQGPAAAAAGGLGPIIGFAPVTQYVPVFAAPSVAAARQPGAVVCVFGSARLGAATVEDCEKAGGTVAAQPAAR